MSKAIYLNINGTAKKTKKMYLNVGGVAKKVKKAYLNVNGVAKLFYSAEFPISNLAVGSSVFLNVDGVGTEFIIVHQGLPSSVYDESCDGTWLLMKNLHESLQWDSENNDYANSAIRAYLDNTFINLLDSGVQSAIKQVKIPYYRGAGTQGNAENGENGLPAKLFLLSGYELGWTTDTNSGFPVDGACLDYFVDCGNYHTKRAACYNGESYDSTWWTRSCNVRNTTSVWTVLDNGSGAGKTCTNQYGVRPALILPKDVMVDGSFNIVSE